jgi:hypothetical protein
MNGRSTMCAFVFLVPTALVLSGCVKRTIEITSTPSDALVYLNTIEVGRTPLTVAFTDDGVYDVRLHLAGHAPLVQAASTDPPTWDLPGPDFVAEILPFTFERSVRWHFDLTPIDSDPAAQRDRAAAMRASLLTWDIEDESTTAARSNAPGPERDASGLIGTPKLERETNPEQPAVEPPPIYSSPEPASGGVGGDDR